MRQWLTLERLGAGCAPDQRVAFSDVDSLVSLKKYDLLVGPQSRFASDNLTEFLTPLLNNVTVPPEVLSGLLDKVDSLSQFNDYIDIQYRNITPGGFFLGDGSTPTSATR
jgi:ATP-binding cassette subfamily A (ABC1) protein 3